MIVDITTATKIQSEVSDRSGAGYDDMEPIIEKYVELGFDEQEVTEAVEDGMKELAKVYGN